MTYEFSKEFLESFNQKTIQIQGNRRVVTKNELEILESNLHDVHRKISAARIGGAGDIGKLSRERDTILAEMNSIKAGHTEYRVVIESRGTAYVQASDKNSAIDKALAEYNVPKTFRGDFIYGTRRNEIQITEQSEPEEKGQLDEKSLADADVLKSAKTLAANAKDDKTKSFGQGLVDHYEKNKSFTPDQVSGLMNIMKKAPFQLAKESVELDESMDMDSVKKLDKINDLDELKAAAIKILKNSKTSAKKMASLEQNIKTSRKKEGVLSIIWNSILSGEGKGSVSSKWMKEDLDEAISFERDIDEDKPVIAKGVMGARSKPFKKKFKNMDAFGKWTDSDDYDNYDVQQVMNEGTDPVEKDEAKGKFKNRDDKDIDNDGDVDDSDEYLHKRRNAIADKKDNK